MSEQRTRTVLLVLCPKLRLPGCPYCGRNRKPTAETCAYCDDLPELDDD